MMMLYLRTAVTFVGVGVCLCVVVKGLIRKKTPVPRESKIDPSPLNLTLKLESSKQSLCFAGLQSMSASNKGTRKRMIPKEDIDILIPIIAKNYTLFPNVLPPEELGLLLEDLKHVRWTDIQVASVCHVGLRSPYFLIPLRLPFLQVLSGTR